MNTLPASMQEMAMVIGLSETIAFVRAFGGRRVYIPKRLTSSGAAAISEAIGEIAASKLLAWSGDNFLEVPRCLSALNHKRNLEIITKYNDAANINELVERYHLSHRHIRRILKCTDASAPVDGAQGELGF